MNSFLSKMREVGSSPPRAALDQIMWSWVGSATAIGAIAYAAYVTQLPLLFAPLGASAVLAFAVSGSPLAQPRNIIGGHLVSAIVGLIFLSVLGNLWWVMAFAVATAIAGMLFTKTVHPPAGANPLIILVASSGWDFVFLTVLPGAVLITFCAVIFNNLGKKNNYPLYWW